MKKVLVAVLVMVFCSNIGFANVQQEFIERYLSDRKLDSIEGVWAWQHGLFLTVFYQDGGERRTVIVENGKVRCNIYYTVNKVSENYYTYRRNVFKGESKGRIKSCKTRNIIVNYSISVNNNNISSTTVSKGYPTLTSHGFRIWPTDIVAHNAKFKTKEDIAEEEKILADMVADSRKTCKVLGFEDGSDKFADCTLKLYTQKVGELVAEKQAASARMLQSQTTTTTQSSGSNVTTIYDPVRDNQRMIDQGMKMLSGRCTIGVDC